jgi:uncharacterized protein YbjT (DUF2867 family)
MQGANLVEAARAAAVQHIVYSSIASADRHTGIANFNCKYMVEELIRCCGLPATILRPVFFMENLARPRLLPSLQRGVLALPMRGDRPLQLISVVDIAAAVALAIESPEVFRNRTLELAGDELSLEEVVASLSRALGWPVRYEQLGETESTSRLGPAATRMFRWLEQTGFHVDIPALRNEQALPLLRFDEALEQCGSLCAERGPHRGPKNCADQCDF